MGKEFPESLLTNRPDNRDGVARSYRERKPSSTAGVVYVWQEWLVVVLLAQPYGQHGPVVDRFVWKGKEGVRMYVLLMESDTKLVGKEC
jgi:hypothetical protein